MAKQKALSGKFVIRVPPALHHTLKKVAEREGTSLNQICLNYLTLKSKAPFIPSKEDFNWTQKVIDNFKTQKIVIDGIVAFGSVVRGEEKEGSDYDILIIISSPTELSPQLYHYWDENIAQNVPQSISPHFVVIPSDVKKLGSLWLEVALEGEILYDREDRVKKTLQQIRRFIASGQVQRKVTHGHPYWVFQEYPERKP